MNETATRPLTDILADLDAIQPDAPLGSLGLQVALRAELESAVRDLLAPLPEGEVERLAAETDRAARTMAPPVPGVTRNAGYTVRAVIHMHDAVPGLLETWLVAAEDPERGAWVTWHAYALDDLGKVGKLGYNAGRYFQHPAGTRVNRRDALADLAIRAGTTTSMAERIADEVDRYHSDLHPVPAEDRRMASRLRKWARR